KRIAERGRVRREGRGIEAWSGRGLELHAVSAGVGLRHAPPADGVRAVSAGREILRFDPELAVVQNGRGQGGDVEAWLRARLDLDGPDCARSFDLDGG